MSHNAIIESAADSYALRTPYDPALVADFKALIPTADRLWDKDNRRWLFAPTHLSAVERLCERYNLPVVKRLSTVYAAPTTQTRVLRVEYIGAPKEREDGSVTAFAFVDGAWSVVLPQDVLKAWFLEGDRAPAAAVTYYGLLGLKRDATADDIKRAHRLMVKRWHPDINRDPDAGEMMKRINVAYAILAEPRLRAKYDAGLILEAAVDKNARPALPGDYWRPPLRCGWLMADGVERLGRFRVAKIHQWQDITDATGRVMVTSWPAGADTFKTEWV